MSATPRVRFGAIELSRIILGKWRLTEYGDSSPGALQARIEAALEQGITTIDQADIYGGYEAEEVFGNCLRAAPGLRERLEIVTKCDIVAPVGRHASARVKHYDTSRAHITASVEMSLTLMGLEQIDLLLMHRPDPLMDAGETGACLDALVAEGKVKAVGVSNFRPWDFTLLQSAMSTPLATNQIEISLLHHTPLTNGDVAFHQREGQPLMAWSPLGGGALMQAAADPALVAALDRVASAQGVDRAAVAVAWLLRHPARICPVMGTNSIERIRGFSDAFRVEMDRQTWFEIYAAALGHEVP
jgi:predicted oxidoreductase